MRLAREYPNINGIPVSPHELELPRSTLELDRQGEFNNHHGLWTAKNMGRFVLSSTMRNLQEFQYVLPRDTHAIIHDRYEPAPMPSPLTMMDYLDDAYEQGQLLRYGSALNPAYAPLGRDLMRVLRAEYDHLTSDEVRFIA